MPKPKAEKDTSERWLLTYSDLMNLLLILFIILFCSSQLDAKKSAAVSESLQEGFSTIEGAAAVQAAADAKAAASTSTGDSPGIDAYWDEYQAFFNELNSLLKQGDLQEEVETILDDTGVIISFKDSALFPAGSATLSAESAALMNKIGALLVKLNYSFILVEGHTDSDPISTARFSDNMDLSNARAGNVWRELVKSGLPPEDMASIGYGEYRPVADNDTAENKAKNRRVVISILKNPFTATTDLAAENLAGGAPATGKTSP